MKVRVMCAGGPSLAKSVDEMDLIHIDVTNKNGGVSVGTFVNFV